MNPTIKLINAGAGSGKTYTLTQKVLDFIQQGGSIDQIILTTFTKKAAAELRSRIKQTLIANRHFEEAQKTELAWIGNVHSLGNRLIEQFAFSAGYSPLQTVLPEGDESLLFKRAISNALATSDYITFNRLADVLNVLDWQQDILDIVKKARENNIDLSNHQVLANKSIEQFFDFVGNYILNNGPATADDLITRMKGIADDLRKIGDKGKSPKHLKKAGLIDDFINHYHKNETFDNGLFSEILKDKLESKDASKQEVFDWVKQELDVCELFLIKHQCPDGFKETYSNYLISLFEAAHKSYNQYISFKKERGLVDYSDQENEFYALLDTPIVKQFVANQFKLLLVDEFQDTNPMQLAIFMRLAANIPNTYFVGDPKQSIYGFRGTDIHLNNSVAQAVEHEKALSISRRSRAPLVYFANQQFVPLFHDLPKNHVALEPWDELAEHSSFSPAIHYWNVGDAKNQQEQRTRLVNQLKTWLSGEDAPIIRDKTTKALRAATPGDVAILCKTNADVASWASTLEAIGVEVSAERAGFHQQAEIVMLLAACSFLISNNDSLAASELVLLTDPQFAGAPEKIIDNRLEWLQTKEGEWLNQSNILKQLNDIRIRVNDLGIPTLLEMLVVCLDVYNLAAHWGNAAVRRANIQKLLGLACKYQQRCDCYSMATSLNGFLQWVKSQDNIKQAASLSGNAVKVMTYHSAKGIEWPMVIMDGLQKMPSTNWYGVLAKSPKDGLDIYAPLKNREITFVHSPFGTMWDTESGGQKHKDPSQHIREKIEASTLYIDGLRDKIDEDIRLMYVGITRARDYLIVPTLRNMSVEAWWNNTLGATLPTFFDEKEDYKLTCHGTTVDVKVTHIPLFDDALTKGKAIEYYYNGNTQCKVFEPMATNPSMMIAQESPIADKYTIETLDHLSLPRLCSGADEKDLGDAIHNIFVAWHRQLPVAYRKQMITRTIDGYGLSQSLSEDAIDNVCVHLFEWIDARYKNAYLLKEVPLSLLENKQTISGIADLVIEHDNGIAILDYKSYQGENQLMHSAKYIRQLDTYRRMVDASKRSSQAVNELIIFYPVSGMFVSVKPND